MGMQVPVEPICTTLAIARIGLTDFRRVEISASTSRGTA